MQKLRIVAFLVSVFVAQFAIAESKPTSISDARAAVEANLKTCEGKAYDERLGTEFFQGHLG